MDSRWRRRERRRLEREGFTVPQKNNPAVRHQQGLLLQQQIQSKFSSAPLPPPEQLEHYERVQAGFAERIFVMAERTHAMAQLQTTHRIAMERSVIRNNIRLSYLGLGSAFILGSFGLASATYLIYVGRNIVGLAAFIGSLGALVGSFLFAKRKQSEELAKKRPE